MENFAIPGPIGSYSSAYLTGFRQYNFIQQHQTCSASITASASNHCSHCLSGQWSNYSTLCNAAQGYVVYGWTVDTQGSGPGCIPYDIGDGLALVFQPYEDRLTEKMDFYSLLVFIHLILK